MAVYSLTNLQLNQDDRLYILAGVNGAGDVLGWEPAGFGDSFIYSNGIYIPVQVPHPAGTELLAINANGDVLGFDSQYGNGLIRYSDGSLTTIFVPGGLETYVYAMNDKADVVGFYWDGTANHEYLYSNGTYTTFDGPQGQQVNALGIDNNGNVFAQYSDALGVHNFIYKNGAYTPLDVPGALSTTIQLINSSGIVVGSYSDGTTSHEFIYSNGVYAPLNVPGATVIAPTAISTDGKIAGTYVDSLGQHNFIYSNGIYTSFDAPGAPSAINTAGQVVGWASEVDSPNTSQVYLYRDGAYATLDVPSNMSGPVPVAIDANGNIYTSYDGVVHAVSIANDLSVPSITALSDTGGSDLNAGHVVTIFLKYGENLFVTGTPALQLNDGGTASYSAGSGTDTLTFTYTVQAGEDTSSDLQVTNLEPGQGTIKNAVNDFLAGPIRSHLSLHIDTFAPIVAINTGGGLTNEKDQAVAGTVDVLDTDSTVAILDGVTQVGSTSVLADGSWIASITLAGDGVHTLTAKAIDGAGNVGVSDPITFTLDTMAPAVAEALVSDTGASSTDRITSNASLSGAGDSNAVVHFTVDGTVIAATATADIGGNWSFAPTGLADGSHTIVANETDAAGNTGSASLAFTLDTTPPSVTIANETLGANKITVTGSASDPSDLIYVYDNGTLAGTTASAGSGTWTFATGKLSNSMHVFTTSATDAAGNLGQGGNEFVLGSSKADVISGTAGSDILSGNGGNDIITGAGGADLMTGGSGKVTFSYAAATDSAPAAHDTITDFSAKSDLIDFTSIAGINATKGIPQFQGNITGIGNLILNTHSVAYLEVNGNTEVLVNTTSSAETITTADTHAASMEIDLVGVGLKLTASDFHHV